MSDENFILCRYARPKRGSHPLTGATVFPSLIQGVKMRRSGAGYVIDYGYRNQNEVFLVHKQDQKAQESWFLPQTAPEATRVIRLPERQRRQPPAPPAAVWSEPEEKGNGPLDLQTLPGVTPVIAERLREAGLITEESILQAGVTGLKDVKGIGDAKATSIIQSLNFEATDMVQELQELLA